MNAPRWGGALENARVKPRFAGVYGGVLFAVLGVFAASVGESANATNVALCPRDGEISSAANPADSDPGCLPPKAIEQPVSFGEDLENVRAGYVAEDLVAVLGYFRPADGHYVVVANESANDVVYEMTSPLALFPQDARLPVFPLTLLTANFTVSANMQEALVFNPGGISVDTSNEGGLRGVQPYFSEPRAMLTAAECPFGVNALGNGCIPPTEMDCRNLDPERILMGEMCVEIPDVPQVSMSVGGEMTATATMTTEASAKKDERDFPVVGAIVMGLLIFGLSNGGEEGEFSYSPAFGYSVNESGYSANVGGRMDFRKDEWTLFYTGGQTNANGDWDNFRYASGGEYKTDFWKASFSESVQGERADYDLSLSADMSGGIWSLSPVHRLHSRLEEGETETRNSLNLEGILEWNRWKIRQSAGFGWRRAEDFGDSAKFRLEAVREF